MSIIKDWITRAGLRAIVYRVESRGHLCGYVSVPDGHPLFGKGYGEEVPELQPALDSLMQMPVGTIQNMGVCAMLGALSGTMRPSADNVIRVHGGVTFAGVHRCIDAPGAWWLGFDCAHSGDAPEGGDEYGLGGVYRDEVYVTAECESMAEQIAAIAAAREGEHAR
jgi:hypothetical protein